MNNPVLLPKRKDYGFLKAPPSLKNLKLISNSIVNSNNNGSASIINSCGLPNGRHLMHFKLSNKKDYIAHTCKQISINHKLDNIQIKYELKTPNFFNPRSAKKGRSAIEKSNESLTPPTQHLERIVPPIPANTPKGYTVYHEGSIQPPFRSATLQNIDFKREHLKRQAYVTETGTNFLNLQKQHSFLNFPMRRLPLKMNSVTGSTLGSNHFEILTTQLNNNPKNPSTAASTVLGRGELSSSSSSDDPTLKAYSGKRALKKDRIVNDCESCNNDTSKPSSAYNHADCIMCKFKNRFSRNDLPKISKKRPKAKKVNDVNLNIERIKTSTKPINNENSNSKPTVPFPHLQKSLLSEKVYNFYDREDTSTESNEIFNDVNITNENDKLLIDLKNTNIDNDDEITPKLTLWLV